MHKLLLVNPRSKGDITTGEARDWVRNKLRSRGATDAAKAVKDAIEDLLGRKWLKRQANCNPAIAEAERWAHLGRKGAARFRPVKGLWHT